MADIPKLVLYPEDEEELLEQLYDRIRAASNGTLTDFSPSSPLAALAEGQLWATLELLWYLNKLPEALALEVMRITGVQRSPGTKTKGRLTFLLTSPLGSPFTLPVGYLVALNGASQTGYVLTETLLIPPGSLEGSVAVEASQTGSAYNRPAFGVALNAVGLAFVQSVYNPEPLTGGSDLEPLSSTLRRAQLALRDRKALVSAADYERAAQEELGNGSKAWAVPLLASDRETQKAGHVHVFVLGADRQPPNTATCTAIQSALRQLAFAGSSTWVSPVALQEVRVDLTVGVTAISLPLAEEILEALREYTSPFSYPLGGTLRHSEVIFYTRKVVGVTEVTDCLLQNHPVNYPMPNRYTLPIIGALTVTQVDPNGRSATFTVGNGFVDPD